VREEPRGEPARDARAVHDYELRWEPGSVWYDMYPD
jgi:hypothetical protein